MELGQRLKQARLDAGLSQRQLCADVITRNMLSQIENGTAQPSMDTLRYLAGQLGKSVSFFLGEEPASPNQQRMAQARHAYATAHYAQTLEILEPFQLPDPILEAEYHLLTALCCLSLAQIRPDQAEKFLLRAAEAGARTPYYAPMLYRRQQLLLAQTLPDRRHAILSTLPLENTELLLRAQDALDQGDPHRCIRLLDAVEDTENSPWLLLRGDAAVAAGNDQDAVRFLSLAEPLTPALVYPRLEQCYLRLENYKMAYHYACKQR